MSRQGEDVWAEGLWDWARRVHATAGVEAACLRLQDEAGQSAPLLLWAAWAAGSGRVAWPAGLEAAAVLARAWEDKVVGPLRTARRALKTAPGVSDTERTTLRAQAQSVELGAERAVLSALEALTPAQRGPGGAIAEALTVASAAWGQPAPAALVEALAVAITASHLTG